MKALPAFFQIDRPAEANRKGRHVPASAKPVRKDGVHARNPPDRRARQDKNKQPAELHNRPYPYQHGTGML